MCTKSTSGLSRQEEMVQMPRFVADTKIVQIRGIASLSVTIPQELTEDQPEDAFHKKRNYITYRDTSGKYSIDAKLAENDRNLPAS